MRRILSERNLVIILFVLAVVVSSFAQYYTNKAEKAYLEETAISPIPVKEQTATIQKERETEVETGVEQGAQ